MSRPVLEIRDLTVGFETRAGTVRALRNVSLDVPRGEIVGVVGESGSGKSTLALAILRLLPETAGVEAGCLRFGDTDLAGLREGQMRALRGARIAMVFQDPMTSLNPVRSIGDQMTDIQHHDRHVGRGEKRRRAAAALARVGIPDAERQLDRYPFQFSGGMRQRIAIAMGLLQRPELLIADEVTTALDVTLAAQILHLLRELRNEIDGAIMFISHDLGAVAEICDRIVVLYAGEVMEQGPIVDVFANPRHPYTRALIDCDPARIAEATRTLPVIPGDVPDLAHLPPGCVFAPRCPRAEEVCRRTAPPEVGCGAGHTARCHFAVETAAP